MKHGKKIAAVSLLVVLIAVACWFILRPRTTHAPINETSKTDTTMNQTQESSSNSPAQPAVFDKKTYSVDDTTSKWVVVNKQRPLSPIAYAPSDLVAVGGGQYMRQEAAQALQTMMNDAKQESLTLLPLSGYRSYATQQTVYANEVKNYGQSVADTQSARPGHSEHQTGWAIDVGGGGCGIEDCFGQTVEGKWVAANGYKYGFIIRYQPGTEAITGYRAEPWHIRYVGSELAAELQKTAQTLEEFFGLPAAPTY